MDQKIKQQLIDKAEQAWKNAYAPYSHFRVGSAILTKSGEIFQGCNVENLSYGLSSCSERNAIFSAVSQIGKIEIEAVAIMTESDDGAAPCGACRQVIAEFGPQATVIYKRRGQVEEATLDELLPSSFDRFQPKVAVR